jgi:uridine phosphorylase
MKDSLRPYTASDLPIDKDGRIYHLQITPEQLATDIIIVGDPGRAESIGKNFLSKQEYTVSHRGLSTTTGIATDTNRRTTITTSGMGTPSLEIVLQELFALNEIDFQSRVRKKNFPTLRIIRVGTSGALQSETKLGTPIITSYTIGMDNSGLYYNAGYLERTTKLLEEEVTTTVHSAIHPDSRFAGKVFPYVSKVSPLLVTALENSAQELGITTKTGITISNSGFFAAQGRDIARIPLTLENIDQLFADWSPSIVDLKAENMEMEASMLTYLSCANGYIAGAICPAIAHRKEDTFDHNYQESVDNATRVAFQALAHLG